MKLSINVLRKRSTILVSGRTELCGYLNFKKVINRNELNFLSHFHSNTNCCIAFHFNLQNIMTNDSQQLKASEEEEEQFTLVTSRRKTKSSRKSTASARSVVGAQNESDIDEDSVLK